MLLGKVLLRPQNVKNATRPRIKELDLFANLIMRLAKELLRDSKVSQMIQEEFGGVFEQFMKSHTPCIEKTKDKLLAWVAPFIDFVTEFSKDLDNGSSMDMGIVIFEKMIELAGSFSKESIKEKIGGLFAIIQENLGEFIGHYPDQLIKPFLDRIILKLEQDYLDGNTEDSARNRFLLGKDVETLRRWIAGNLSKLDFHFSIDDIKTALLNYLDKIDLDSIIKKVTDTGTVTKNAVDLVFSLMKTFTGPDYNPAPRNTAKSNINTSMYTSHTSKTHGVIPGNGDEPVQYLWYLSWLFKGDYYKKGNKIYRNNLKLLFVTGTGYINASDEIEFSPALREEFRDNSFELSDNIQKGSNIYGLLWRFYDVDNDQYFTFILENNLLFVYNDMIYLNDDWTQIILLNPYTFKCFSPQTMDKITFHFSWIVNVLRGVLQINNAAVQGRYFSHVLNILLNFIYAGCKTIGPSGFNWSSPDIPISCFTCKWFLPILLTFYGSFEDVYVKDDWWDAFLHWLVALLLWDMVDMVDPWFESITDGVLSFMTLMNYDGPWHAIPGDWDRRPLNRYKSDGFVYLFVEAGAAAVAALYPDEYYGFPNKDHGYIWLHLITHLFWSGIMMGTFSGFVGHLAAQLVGRCIDWKTIGSTVFKSIKRTTLKYMPYLYMIHDGDTDNGKYDGSEFNFPGYPEDKENSPYKLPYANGKKIRCVQGNMGIWSHTAHSNASQVYGLDFGMDKEYPVLCSREGTIDSFEEDTSNHHKSSGWNVIRIRHSTIDPHDRDADNRQVITYMEYGHGVKNCVTTAFGGTTPPGDNSLTVVQGQKIFLAGDTGISVYNHLHVHVKPQKFYGGLYAGVSGDHNAIVKWTGRGKWRIFGDELSGPVYSIVVEPDTDPETSSIFAGGDFVQAGGIDVNYIARWNSKDNTWEALGTGLDGRVRAMFFDNDKLYVGGDFTKTGDGNTVLDHFAVWDTSTSAWSQLGAGLDDKVHCIFITDSGEIYAGGDFALPGGNCIAKWDPGAPGWVSLGAGLNGTVRAITVDTGNIYAGGDFTNHVAMWNGTAWNPLGGGLDGPVRTLAFALNKLYAGGDFMNANGNPAPRVALWNAGTSTWSSLGNVFNDTVNAIVLLADAVGAVLYVGGKFTSVPEIINNYNALWNSLSWTHLAGGVDHPITCFGLTKDPYIWMGDYTIPFVYADVEDDGVCKALRMYEAGAT